MVIRVNFAPWTPWSEPIVRGNITTLGGIARDVYDSFGRIFNLKFDISIQADLTFGALDATGKWTGMIGSMRRNESDMSGPFFITENRANAVDFSVPVGFSQLAIMSGLVPANREPLLIFKIFSLQVWLFIVVFTLLASTAAAIIYTTFPPQAVNKKSKREAFFKYMWLFYGTLLGKDFGSSERWFLKSVLVSASFRLLLYIWLVGPALVLNYTYQGAITSTFASDKLKPKIQSLEELHQNKDVLPSTLKDSFPFICFKNLKGSPLETLIDRLQPNLKTPAVDFVPDWLDDVERGKMAFVAEVTITKSMVGDRFGKKGRCGIYVTPVDFCPAYISFAFRENYRPKLQRKFNRRLLWYSEGRLEQRHILASLANYDVCTRAKSSTAKPLQLTDLLGAFIVYCTGICASLLVFFFEKAVECKIKKN